MKEQNVAFREVLQSVIKTELARTPEARYLHRLHCVLLVLHGHPSSDVADWLGNDPSTVARWMRHFKAFGADGLRDDPRTGRPSKIVYDHLAALQKDVRGAPSAFGYRADQWNGTLLATHLERRYGITLSVRQCQRLLKQLRLAVPERCSDEQE